jgi:hypothetical protein
VDFTALSKKEADDYLASFVADTPDRLEWLRQQWVASGRPVEELDYSPASLTPLWAWAIGEVTPRGDESPGELPTWVDPRMGAVQFSDRTLWVIDAVGRYLGEVFVRNADGASWTVARARTKNYVHQNWPAIGGLSDFANPVQLVQVAATGVLHGDEPVVTRLRELYDRRVGKG